MIKINSPYLRYVLDIIEDIENSIKNISKNNFDKDKDKKEANARRLEMISRAMENISEKLKNKYSNIEWEKFIEIQDILKDHYFGLNFNTIWKIIKEDLPKLKLDIKDILKKEKNNK